jgi:hypothetical protein
MAQAVDGNWYGYFADKTQASIADGNNNNKSADIKKLNNRSDAFYINYSDKQK